MKKLLNNPNDYADQTLEGLCLAQTEFYTLGGENHRVIHRSGRAIDGKDGKWHWAKAPIEDKTVGLASGTVPVRVRHA